jgi:DNA-binding HxlR family transcriptional regulator
MPETGPSNLERERAGSRALSIFARVLSARILRAHEAGALTSRELEARMGWAAKASLRVAVGNLRALGALAQTSPTAVRRGVTTELTPAGRELLSVADVLEHWLSASPFGPIPLPDTAARGVIRALVGGWDSAIVRTLAEGPRSLSELSSEIGEHTYAALKRRLSMLRSVNLVSPVTGNGRSPSHEATKWLRCAVGPLTAAGRWERRHAGSDTPPMTRHEIEAALLLALPLVELSDDLSGSCVLAAPANPGASQEIEPVLAAVSLVVEDGRIETCESGADDTPRTWALGTPDAWLDAMIDGRCDELRLRGPDAELVEVVVAGLHEALFPATQARAYASAGA